jgi:hypothetical protein
MNRNGLIKILINDMVRDISVWSGAEAVRVLFSGDAAVHPDNSQGSGAEAVRMLFSGDARVHPDIRSLLPHLAL